MANLGNCFRQTQQQFISGFEHEKCLKNADMGTPYKIRVAHLRPKSAHWVKILMKKESYFKNVVFRDHKFRKRIEKRGYRDNFLKYR